MNNSPDTPTLREIQISWDRLASDALRQKLQSQLHSETVALELRKACAHGALTDPTVLVAVVGGASAALTAVIMGLFKLLEGQHQKIVLQAQDGSRLEIPWNTPKERIEELIALVHHMHVDRIRVVEEEHSTNTPERSQVEQSLPRHRQKAAPEP